MSCERHAKRAAYMREWTAKNKERINAKRRAAAKTDEQKALGRERDRRWRENNPEHVGALDRAKAASWRKRHPEKALAAVRAYEKRNPDKAREWGRNTYARRKQNDPLGLRASKAIQKHRRRNAPGSFTKEQFLARWAYFAGICWICKTAPGDTIDHVIPVSRGGTNWPANLRPACMPCNRRKYNRVVV